MKATPQESFGLDMDGAERMDWMEKGLPILCYTMLKP